MVAVVEEMVMRYESLWLHGYIDHKNWVNTETPQDWHGQQRFKPCTFKIQFPAGSVSLGVTTIYRETRDDFLKW